MAAPEQPEQYINVDGVPIPLSVAGKAVRRCIRGIQLIDKTISTQGFASKEDLQRIRAGLTGEDVEQNVAPAGPKVG